MTLRASFLIIAASALALMRSASAEEASPPLMLAQADAEPLLGQEPRRAGKQNAGRAEKKREAGRGAQQKAIGDAGREAKRASERKAQRAAEQDAARGAERKAKRAAEQEAQRGAEQEAQRGAEQEAQRGAERKAQRAAEQEAQRAAERDAKRAAESQEIEEPGNARQEKRGERARRREQLEARPSEPAAPTASQSGSTVEQQIQIQRGSGEVRELRRLRDKLDRERQRIEAQQDEVESDKATGNARERRWRERQERRQADRTESRKPTGERPAVRRGGRQEREVVRREGDRIIFRLGDRLTIQPERDGDRLLSGARDVQVEYIGNGETRTTVYRRRGVRIVTIYDHHGDIVRRARILPGGHEIVLIDNRPVEHATWRGRWSYAEIEPLPPLVLNIPQEEYIVETRRATPHQVQAALAAAPVERVERAYTLDEVRYSDRIRDKVRRVDLDTITFDFGSAAIGLDQLDALDSVGLALEEIIRGDADEIFLIEGHTDAVGSDEANLILSDKRAEAAAVALSEDFDIPPENLVTQGYGEQQLKIQTPAPERENRRVAVRRITSLLRAQR
jgi:outer membrane protein OmpA-like peptidoglycan-associated protein